MNDISPKPNAVPRKKGVTIVDVAREAGVGNMTVSRFFRDPNRVAPKTRERIAKVVERLGYAPSPAARALASKRSDFIGVVIPSITNNVFSDVLDGLYQACEGTEVQVQIGNAHYDALEEEAIVKSFLLQNPLGLIITGTQQTEATKRMLRMSNARVVQIMEYTNDPIDMIIGLDHKKATAAAIEHFLDQGYRKPAFLAARQDPRVQFRLEAFKNVTHSAGIDASSRVLITKDRSSAQMGSKLMADLLEQAPEVDAVFCNNDDIALGALFECLRQGVPVPDRVGICGYSDFEVAATTFPSLTSVKTNRLEMGKRAMELLLSAVRGEEPKEKAIDVGFQVISRESTARR